MKNKTILFLIFMLINSITLYAQLTFQFFSEVSLSDENSTKLSMPWAGGLNGVQYNMIDLDQDGNQEIAAFDRSTNTVRCFFYENGQWLYKPGYENQFPADIFNFFILIDYNNDGFKDLFTAGPLGIIAYENTSTEFGISWKKSTNFIQYESLSGNQVNLQTSFNDYPYLADVDNDGDIDILTFNFSGLESTINYYKNLSTEKNGMPDITDFQLINNRWGQVEDCDCGIFALNNNSCSPGRPMVFDTSLKRHAGGKSVFIKDLNNDGVLELVLSHEECAALYYFTTNDTSNFNAIQFNSFTADFPGSEPAKLNFYPNMMPIATSPMASKEIIVSPNLEGNLGSPINFRESNYLYKIDEQNQYQLSTKAFLQEDMIDLGYQSSPSFYDVNQDGLNDLLIAYTSTNTENELFSGIAYYENVGNENNPAFQLRDNDFLSGTDLGLANLHIQIKDINQDGYSDLMLQATLNNDNKLYFSYGNQSGLQLAQLEEITEVNIGFGYNLHLADVAGDNGMDLLVGKSSGGLILYENTGTLNAPQFTLNQQNFLSISDDFFRSRLRVLVDDIDNDEEDELITSDQSGIMRIYHNPKNYQGQVDSLKLYNTVDQKTNSFNFGRSNIVSSSRLLNADYPSLVIGTLSGGIQWLRNTAEYPIKESPKAENIVLYPNPNSERQLTIISSADAFLTIVNTDGKVIYDTISIENGTNQLGLQELSHGLYLFQFQFRNGTSEQKKVIIN